MSLNAKSSRANARVITLVPKKEKDELLTSDDVSRGAAGVSIFDSSRPKEIGRGERCYELEERETSRGAAGEDHMVTGASSGDHGRGGRRRTTRRLRFYGERRGGEMSRGFARSPWVRWRCRRSRGRPDSDMSVLEPGGRRRGNRVRLARLEASQLARLEEEVEELEAETTASSACSGTAGDDGGRDGGVRRQEIQT